MADTISPKRFWSGPPEALIAFSHSPALILCIVGSCALAAAIPYDVLFGRATVDSAAARAVAMLCFWGAGLWLQRANGFSIGVTPMRLAIPKIAAIALGVAIWCLVMDELVFRSILPDAYFSFERQPLGFRLLYYCSRAFNENVMYRFFLGSLFAWMLRRAIRKPSWSIALAVAGMALAQAINVIANTAFAGFSIGTSAWMFFRFFLPGTLWGWLYVRHGFAANEGAAISVHWFLQPAVGAAIALF